MYSLFSTPPRLLTTHVVTPRFVDVERKIVHDVEHIRSHYQGNEYVSRGDHFLVKLIQNMSVPLHYPVDRYYDICLERSNTIANIMNLTTSGNRGHWFKSVFYHGCDEIIIASNSGDRASELEKNWRQLQAVRVLEHPVSNLSYMLPNGVRHNTERGLAVIHVDIAKLMLQYRCFTIEQMAGYEAGEGLVLDERHFLYRYVFPNMLYSQTDLAIMNRCFNLAVGAPMGTSERRHSFRISDYTELLDKGLLYLIERLKHVKMSYWNVLREIPKVFSDHPTRMPDMAETRQVYWALWLARVRVMRLLIELTGDTGSHYNQGLLNELQIDLKRFRSDNTFKAMLPDEIYQLYLPQIETLSETSKWI